jgi:hypothetical protein
VSILALDLATKTGWAFGQPHSVPYSGSWKLKDGEDPPERAFKKLIIEMRNHFEGPEKPKLVVLEKPMFNNSQGRTNSSTLYLLQGLIAVAVAAAGVYEIPCKQVSVASVRTAILGRGKKIGDQKRLTLDNLKLRGALPADCFDTDRSDATAIHIYASGQFFPKHPALAAGLGRLGQ